MAVPSSAQHPPILTAMPDAVRRVAAALNDAGLQSEPMQKSAVADAPAGQMARTTVFRRTPDNSCVVVIAAGDRNLDDHLLEALVALAGQRLVRADAAFVTASTGQPMGGVAPFGLAHGSMVLIDRSLSRFEHILLPCGDPGWVVRMQPQELEWLTEAPVVDVVVHPDDEALAREEAVRLVLARAASVSDTGDIVPSPCISVCRINASSGICEGCFRTLGEISAWGRSTPDAKRKLWLVIRERTLQPG
jgi:prolyl-tRNA editing enzyme YbaK/EbsC (Cys-tRNA(Pro) deacylase)/predicted Fe-S protein YdhL (DUF1289 family)